MVKEYGAWRLFRTLEAEVDVEEWWSGESEKTWGAGGVEAALWVEHVECWMWTERSKDDVEVAFKKCKCLDGISSQYDDIWIHATKKPNVAQLCLDTF